MSTVSRYASDTELPDQRSPGGWRLRSERCACAERAPHDAEIPSGSSHRWLARTLCDLWCVPLSPTESAETFLPLCCLCPGLRFSSGCYVGWKRGGGLTWGGVCAESASCQGTFSVSLELEFWVGSLRRG